MSPWAARMAALILAVAVVLAAAVGVIVEWIRGE